MAVKFTIWNDDGEVVLDSDTPVFQLLQKDTWTYAGQSGAYSEPRSHSTNYGTIIKTNSNSLIFVKVPAGVWISGLRPTVTPNQYLMYSTATVLEYAEVVLSYDVEPVTGYGLNLWDDSGRCTFSSRLPVLKAAANYLYSPRSGSGDSYFAINTDVTFSTGAGQWICFPTVGFGSYYYATSSGNDTVQSLVAGRYNSAGNWTIGPIGVRRYDSGSISPASTWTVGNATMIVADID